MEEFKTHINFRPNLRQERVSWIGDIGELSWGGEEWCCDQNNYPIGLFDRLLDKHAVCFEDSSRINKNVNEICKSSSCRLALRPMRIFSFHGNQKVKVFLLTGTGHLISSASS